MKVYTADRAANPDHYMNTKQSAVDNELAVDNVGDGRRYHDQDLGQVWTFEEYGKYEGVNWDWVDLPFSDDYTMREYRRPRVTRPVKGSILEVGSAMGSSYNFLRESQRVDLGDYTGIEVSAMGTEASKRRFPDVNWVNADFTRFALSREYDYVYERVSVHHMPEPLSQYKKMLQATRIAMMTSFRGCLRGPTVSDLSKAYFRTRDDKYFCNIINLFELVGLGLDLGFPNIRVMFCGLHETVGTDAAGQHYIAAELQNDVRKISRFQVRFSRVAADTVPMIYLITTPSLLLKQLPVFLEIRRILASMALINAYTRS